MISCIYNSVPCVNLLLLIGGVRLDLKDTMDRNLSKLCCYYGSVDSYELID